MREKFFGNTVFESMEAVVNKLSEACVHYETHTDTTKSITVFKWIEGDL